MIATAKNIAAGIELFVEPVAEPVVKSPESAPLSAAASGKMPPTERDFAIYREVVLQGESTRHVADQHGLSQTRVRQLLTRVIEFLVRAVPSELPEQTKEQRLVVAEQLARLHLEHLYRELLQMWEVSQRVGDANGLGKASYLTSAARVVGIMAKLPVHALPAFASDSDEPDADEPNATVPPPVGDCSNRAVSRGSVEHNDFFARPAAAPTCAAPTELPAGHASKNFAPAQSARLPVKKAVPGVLGRDRLATEGLPDIPLFDDAEHEMPCEVPPDSPAGTLTRQQRRSRERLLRQKLGK